MRACRSRASRFQLSASTPNSRMPMSIARAASAGTSGNGASSIVTGVESHYAARGDRLLAGIPLDYGSALDAIGEVLFEIGSIERCGQQDRASRSRSSRSMATMKSLRARLWVSAKWRLCRWPACSAVRCRGGGGRCGLGRRRRAVRLRIRGLRPPGGWEERPRRREHASRSRRR